MRNFLSLAICVLFPAAVSAQHSDVLVTNIGGQVVIGAAEDVDGPSESFDTDTKVFESVLLPGFSPVATADYESDEPGFFGLNSVGNASDLTALGATALPAGAGVSISSSNFTVDGQTASLFYWDGTGAVSFAPAAAGTTFGFDPAANFATTNANGGMDDHPIYELDAASGAPADGAYLIAPVVDVDGLTTSEKFYIVLLADSLITGEDDAELVEEALEGLEEGIATDALVQFPGGASKDFAFYEEAVEFVADNLVVPEPNTALLGLMAMAMLCTKKNRR